MLNVYAMEKLGKAVNVLATSTESPLDALGLHDVMRVKDLDLNAYPVEVQQRHADLARLMSMQPVAGQPTIRIIEMLIALYGEVCYAEGEASVRRRPTRKRRIEVTHGH